jgi:hypothetical protein
MLSIIYGGITHHYLAKDLPYCNTIKGGMGTIHNEYVIAMAGSSDFRLGALVGKDSACGNIFGPMSATRLSDNIDFMLGGYNTNFKKFRERMIEPPSIGGITPVIGLDFKIPIYEEGDTKLSLDTLVSVGVITHAINFSF